MAKAIIKYDLSDIDDMYAHKRAIKSLDMVFALWEITRNTKKGLEWSMESKEMDKYEALEMVYEKIFEVLSDHNIDLEDLME
jgi:hypothetical protein